MNYILFDDHSWDQLLPLTFTRPVSELRVGILKIREKWEKFLNAGTSILTRDYLQHKFPVHYDTDNILINSSLLPCPSIVNKITGLKTGQSIIHHNRIIAIRLSGDKANAFNYFPEFIRDKSDTTEELQFIDRPWDIFTFNGAEIQNDLQLITKNRKSAGLSNTINVISPEDIFVEEGFKAEFITINASTGPVYLGMNSEIMEGSVIRGPFALCENSVIKSAAKIYGSTTVGPNSTAGGEIKNSVIQGFSNKSHDGFLGDSVLGEWCNIGADSNNSNLKNNYADVKLWSYPDGKFINTGLQFCGLIMGDHSKCGINTMFNTGTVVGVNANIFGSGFLRNFIPSFSWGGPQGFTVYSISKALEVAEIVMSRRKVPLNETDRNILMHVFNLTEKDHE